MARLSLLFALVLAFVLFSRVIYGVGDNDKEEKAGKKCEPQRKNVPLDDDVYDALFSVLSGTRSFKDWPNNSETNLRQKVYRKWKSDMYEVKEIHDPIVGCSTKRITYKKTDCIVVRKSQQL
ncbi:hypothetical protein OS493_012907 [Desmophyllum pertusum]|uniref:Uncharacterized protein n=1 Tax=Desmophyllum pertusum TaxID=174260 RepID=A0A9X0CRZ8_9CNID|nr:hypothetical protein OS493_012907 [Desmophyllum pertusum]